MAGRVTRGCSEFDDFGADAENRTHSDIYTLRGNAELSLFDGFWRQEFAASTGRTDRDSFAFGSLAAFDGRREGAEWLNHFKLPLNNLVTVGVEGKRESFSSNFNPQEQDMHTRSLFVQDQVSFADRVFITAGARTDDNSTFGGETTWRLTAAWHVDGPATKVKSSCGSGYKAPSLFQLFDPIFGNTTLQPEKIRGCDVGFEQMLWGDQVTFGSTVFQNDITNMIDFDFSTFKYNNVARAKMRGMENIVTVRPDMYTVLNATHTWLVAQDEVSTFALVRRPKHAFTASADRDFAEGRAHIGVALRAMGDRPDTDASFSRGTNPFFYTVGVNGSYKVNENVELYGRLENLFDRDYEEVMVYGSPGFSTFVGVRTSF